MNRGDEGAVMDTPWRLRLKAMRKRYLPLAVWMGILLVLISVSRREWNRLDARGMVVQRQVAVSPLFDGILRSIEVDLFDKVDEGQIIAVMDDTLIREELQAAEAELGGIRATMALETARLRLDGALATQDLLNAQRRFALDTETIYLDYLDRMIDQASDKINLELLRVDMEKQKQLFESRVTDEYTYEAARLRHEALGKQVKENEQALATTREQVEAARARTAEAGAPPLDVDTETLLKAFEEAVRVRESVVQSIQEKRELLTIKAPMLGKVNQILHSPGDTVLAGDPVLTIARSDSVHIVAYVDLRMIDRLIPGEAVEVYSRRKNVRVMQARILKVGPQVDPYPVQMLASPQFPQWGMPILIGEVPNGLYYPGEIVDVRIRR